MFKRNLIVIAIAILGLGITSAFGQAANWEIKSAVKKPKTTIKKPISKPNGLMQDYYAHSNIQSKSSRKRIANKSNFLPEKDDQVLIRKPRKRKN